MPAGAVMPVGAVMPANAGIQKRPATLPIATLRGGASGPPLFAGVTWHRRSRVQRLIKVGPIWIEPLDQFELPLALPFLQLLLPRDRMIDVTIVLVPDQHLHRIFRSEL
jgi:hypothetical protein